MVQPRPARRAGHRRGPRRLEPRRSCAARARDSLETRGGARPGGLRHACRSCCSYVGGDYDDPATFAGAASRRSAPAKRPAHYLAIPAESVRDRRRAAWRRRAAPPGARVIVEKPFGRDLASAEALNATLHAALSRGVDLPHRPLPGQGAGPEPALLPLRQLVPRADLEPQLRRERADHHGRGVRRAGPRQVLRGGRRDSRRASRTICSRSSSLLAMEPPGGRGTESVRDEKAQAFRCDAPARPRRRGARPVSRLPRRRRRGAPTPQVETFAAVRLHIDSWRWAGVPFYIRAGKKLPVTATEVLVELKRPPVTLFADCEAARPNHFRFRLSPQVVLSLGARAKTPGEQMRRRRRRPHRLPRSERRDGALRTAARRRHARRSDALRPRGRGRWKRGGSSTRC